MIPVIAAIAIYETAMPQAAEQGSATFDREPSAVTNARMA
jgi:hypothetical protein